MAPLTVLEHRRHTLDSVRVYIHEPLSEQLPSLIAGNAPVSNNEEEARSGTCAPRGTIVSTFHLVLPSTQSTFISHPSATSSRWSRGGGGTRAPVLAKKGCMHAACILQVPYSYWFKCQNQTRLQRQKKNQARPTRDSRSAGRGSLSISLDSAVRCLLHHFSLLNRAADRGPNSKVWRLYLLYGRNRRTCLNRPELTSWTVLVHVVLAPLSQMTSKTHAQAPVCLRWTMAPLTVLVHRRHTLDSVRVYVHEPLSEQLPGLIAGNAPVSNNEEEARSGTCAPRGTIVWTFHLVLPSTQSTFISHPSATSSRWSRGGGGTGAPVPAKKIIEKI